MAEDSRDGMLIDGITAGGRAVVDGGVVIDGVVVEEGGLKVTAGRGCACSKAGIRLGGLTTLGVATLVAAALGVAVFDVAALAAVVLGALPARIAVPAGSVARFRRRRSREG